MKYKYGNFSKTQISLTKQKIRKQIFFLLLCADPYTCSDYTHVDLNKAFEGLLYKLDGLNSLLGNPQEIVDIICLLEKALIEYNTLDFDFQIYRKLILNAGSLVMDIKEVD